MDYGEDEYLLLLRASLSSWLAFFMDILGDSCEADSQIQISSKILDLHALKSVDTRSTRAHNLMNSARIQQSRKNESRNEDLWNEQYDPIDIWDLCAEMGTRYGG